MGVSVDRILGWMLEVTDDNLKRTLDDILYEDMYRDKIQGTRYKDCYRVAQKGDIIILDDGMSGKYTYVVSVITMRVTSLII